MVLVAWESSPTAVFGISQMRRTTFRCWLGWWTLPMLGCTLWTGGSRWPSMVWMSRTEIWFMQICMVQWWFHKMGRNCWDGPEDFWQGADPDQCQPTTGFNMENYGSLENMVEFHWAQCFIRPLKISADSAGSGRSGTVCLIFCSWSELFRWKM